MGIARNRHDIAKEWQLAHQPRTRIVRGVQILRGIRPPVVPRSTRQWCKFLINLRPGDAFLVEPRYYLEIRWIIKGLGLTCGGRKCGDLYQYTIIANPHSNSGISIRALARLVEQSIYRARYISRLRRILDRELLSPSQRVLARILIDHPEVTNAEQADLAIVDKANAVAQFLLGDGASWKDLKGKKIVQQRGNRRSRRAVVASAENQSDKSEIK